MRGSRLFIEKVKLSLQKRSKITQNTKTYETWLEKGYTNSPIITVIIQSHNKSLQVCHIVEKLRLYPHIEIIVKDDGSSLEHNRRLAEILCGANEFLLRSNDLYENIMYDRTLRMANGKYVALLQDDDDFDNLDWISKAVEMFDKNQDLAIIGGKDALELFFDEENKYANGKKDSTGNGIRFVESVNRAPMLINKDLYDKHLCHIDFSFAPFQYDDYELCARAWLKGLSVAWYNAEFHSLSVGGMRLWNHKFTTQQCQRNGNLLYNLYADKAAEIKDLVKAKNKEGIKL